MSEPHDLVIHEMNYPFLTPHETKGLRSFAGISPMRYQHPSDTQAMESLKNTAGLEDLIRAFSEHVQERAARVQNITNNIRVSPRQLPELNAIFCDCCARLGVALDTELYIAQAFNAWTSGVERPYVAIGTPLLAILTVPELRFVIGHELGHVLMRHMSYHQMAQWGLGITTNSSLIGSIPFVGSLLKAGLGIPLRQWYRLSEFSADRAGLAVCQDFQAAGQALMKLSQFPLALVSRLNLASIVEQARELETTSENWLSSLFRFASEDSRSHPWPVVRVGELHRWYAEGEYPTLMRETPELSPSIAASLWRPALLSFRCPVCAEAVPASDRFCANCGAPVGEKDRHKVETQVESPSPRKSGGKP